MKKLFLLFFLFLPYITISQPYKGFIPTDRSLRSGVGFIKYDSLVGVSLHNPLPVNISNSARIPVDIGGSIQIDSIRVENINVGDSTTMSRKLVTVRQDPNSPSWFFRTGPTDSVHIYSLNNTTSLLNDSVRVRIYGKVPVHIVSDDTTKSTMAVRLLDSIKVTTYGVVKTSILQQDTTLSKMAVRILNDSLRTTIWGKVKIDTVGASTFTFRNDSIKVHINRYDTTNSLMAVRTYADTVNRSTISIRNTVLRLQTDTAKAVLGVKVMNDSTSSFYVKTAYNDSLKVHIKQADTTLSTMAVRVIGIAPNADTTKAAFAVRLTNSSSGGTAADVNIMNTPTVQVQSQDTLKSTIGVRIVSGAGSSNSSNGTILYSDSTKSLIGVRVFADSIRTSIIRSDTNRAVLGARITNDSIKIRINQHDTTKSTFAVHTYSDTIGRSTYTLRLSDTTKSLVGVRVFSDSIKTSIIRSDTNRAMLAVRVTNSTNSTGTIVYSDSSKSLIGVRIFSADSIPTKGRISIDSTNSSIRIKTSDTTHSIAGVKIMNSLIIDSSSQRRQVAVINGVNDSLYIKGRIDLQRIDTTKSIMGVRTYADTIGRSTYSLRLSDTTKSLVGVRVFSDSIKTSIIRSDTNRAMMAVRVTNSSTSNGTILYSDSTKSLLGVRVFPSTDALITKVDSNNSAIKLKISDTTHSTIGVKIMNTTDSTSQRRQVAVINGSTDSLYIKGRIDLQRIDTTKSTMGVRTYADTVSRSTFSLRPADTTKSLIGVRVINSSTSNGTILYSDSTKSLLGVRVFPSTNKIPVILYDAGGHTVNTAQDAEDYNANDHGFPMYAYDSINNKYRILRANVNGRLMIDSNSTRKAIQIGSNDTLRSNLGVRITSIKISDSLTTKGHISIDSTNSAIRIKTSDTTHSVIGTKVMNSIVVDSSSQRRQIAVINGSTDSLYIKGRMDLQRTDTTKTVLATRILNLPMNYSPNGGTAGIPVVLQGYMSNANIMAAQIQGYDSLSSTYKVIKSTPEGLLKVHIQNWDTTTAKLPKISIGGIRDSVKVSVNDSITSQLGRIENAIKNMTVTTTTSYLTTYMADSARSFSYVGTPLVTQLESHTCKFVTIMVKPDLEETIFVSYNSTPTATNSIAINCGETLRLGCTNTNQIYFRASGTATLLNCIFYTWEN